MTASNFPEVSSGSPGEAQALYEAALACYAQGRHAEGVQALGMAAQSGHISAMSLLGGQLLTGRGAPPDPPEGARLIMAAAQRGGGYACVAAAAMVCSGLAGPPDWPRALDYLQRAAEDGYVPAQHQLRILADAWGPTGVRDGRWRLLRRAVNLKAWRTTSAPRSLSDDPSVRSFDSILPPSVCAWIVGRARERLQPAKVYDEQANRTGNASRTNSVAEFSLADMDPVMFLVRERLAAATGLPVAHMEAPQVLHYEVGQCFTRHYDFLDPIFEGHARDIAAQGQRVATALVYLNAEFDGGETDFPVLDLRYRGGPGDALVFANVDAARHPDRRTLHAGLAPTSGEKWLFSQWVRDRPPPGVDHPALIAALNIR
jgi:prolyl 4-hydroxylase